MKVPNLPVYPAVMGIVNVTPDSFYEASRVNEVDVLRQRVRQILEEGGTMIDVGAYSTRPGAAAVSEAEELARLTWALPLIAQEVEQWQQEGGQRPLVSIDTFRASVAEACIRDWGADIINDVSGGTKDPAMLPTVARLGVPYILMHGGETPESAQQHGTYPEGVTRAVIDFFHRQMQGLDPRQVILDPGYGFGKTLEQNYELMRGLKQIHEAFPDNALLVGISRKSMIYRLLGSDANHALNGTTVLDTYALMNGADILRVHDVKEAVEAVKICGNLA